MKRLTKDSLTSRILAFTLAVIVAVGTIPATSFVSKALAVMAGDVEAISEGLTVDDTSIGNVQVTHTGTTTLEWADVDESLGRMEAGWWAGINVTAPNSLDETELKAVKLQKRDGTESAWSSDILFKDVRDEEDKVALWTLITEAKANAGEDIVRQWQFDWDADGNYDQTITITLKPENLLLTKDGAQVFPKLGKVEHLNGGGVSAVAGNETSQTTVTVNEMQLTWSDVDAAAGKDEAGWWTEIKVSAPVGMDAAQLESAKYQSQAGVKDFWTDKDSEDGASEHYIKLRVRLNAAIVNEAEEKGENISTTWQFDWDGNGVYDQTVTYVIVPSDSIELVKENQAVLNINNLPDVLVYGNTTYTVEVTGGSGNGAVSYSIENEKDINGEDADVANVDATGKVTLVRAGSFTLKATKAGDDVYNAASPVTKTVTVQLAAQTGFAFETAEPNPITYNDNNNKFTNKAVGGQSSQDVVYEITEGALYADIDAATGELTIKKAGTVTVKATRPADDRYNAITTTYTVQIKKAKQEIAFDTAGNVDITYGATSYTNAATETSAKYNDQTIMYSVTEGADIASVDATGIVTFNDAKVGTVVVKATKAGDDCYEEATATYTLKVAYLATPSAAPVVSGDQKDANSGWYTGNVKITAPDGYTISYSNKLTGNAWDSYVEYDVEGTKDAKVYLKDTQGGITDVITVAGIQYDETLPENLKISYRTTLWNRVLQFLSFGIYDAPLQVTLTADDGVSGNKEFTYTYGETTKTVAVNGTSYTFDIASKFRGKISFHVTDVAGNVTTDVVAKDDLGNEQVIIVDEDAPVLTTNHVFSANTHTVDHITYTQDAVTLNFEVVDLAFDVYEVKPVLTINGDVKTVTWIDSEGKGTLTYELPYEEGQYVVQLTYTDITGKEMPAHEETIYVDKNQAVISVDDAISLDKDTVYFAGNKVVEIEIKEPNFKAELLSVNVSTSNPLNANETYTDYASYLKTQSNWSLKDNTTDTYVASITLDKDAEYVLELDYVDYSGRDAEDYKSATIVIDKTAPVLKVTYNNDSSAENVKYYKADRTATIEITEHNFDAKDVMLELSAIANDGQAIVDFETSYKALLKDNTKWTHAGDVHTIQIPFTSDADYEWSLKYTDLAGNVEAKPYPETGSDIFTVDKIAPVIKVTYDNTSAENVKYYKADRTATIEITEHNFDAKDVALELSTIANDGQAITDFETSYKALLKDNTKWAHAGDKHTIQIPFTSDADYEWSLEYLDLAGNTESTQNYEFTVDKIAPVIKVTYDNTSAENVKYYKADRTATIEITEHNFDAKDVALELSAIANDGQAITDFETSYKTLLVDNAKWTHNGDVHTIQIPFTSDADYKWSLEYTDLAGNVESTQNYEFIVDKIAPVIKVTYDNTSAENVKYYKADRTATIEITEHNFDAKDVALELSTIANDGQAITDFETSYKTLLVENAKWTRDGDTHTIQIPFTLDADYEWSLKYTDLAGNAESTQNDVFTVDKIAPEMSVEYTNKVVTQPPYGVREYVDVAEDGVVSATITITEHNFDAKDVYVNVVAKNSAEADIAGEVKTLQEEYKTFFTDNAKWTHEGDKYTAVVEFKKDANYTFDVEFVDLAGNSIDEMEPDEFTIDRQDPTDLKIEYSEVPETSGYYNDQVKVTISAKDEISGIRKFDYQYLLAPDVSNVNAGGQGVFDLADGAEIKQEGTTFTAEFYIPKEALNAKNQFNGTVNFIAADWNANQTETEGTDKIVVDNIKPIGKVTYNTPVKEANGISYYSGDIVGTIVINEANFFAQDAKVVVTRDGAEIPVNVKWVDNDVDTHTGTFTLTENGDYFVTVNYKDRSTNEMATYLSNELTLDKDAPVVSVTKIKANTANKDEKYGFTITVSDTNFDATTFKPSLTAVVRAEDGKYSIKTISLGNMTTVEEGKTYSYTVDNLEADGIYTLTSSVKDMADNSYTKLRLSDGTEHDTVRFSINRDGSTFAVDGNTNKLVEQYYVYKVKNDVVIEEINTDPIETYTVKVNGKVLTESEYSTTISNSDGEWYKRTYTIRKELFKGEGEYNIVVESTDKAGTVAYSDVKNLKISFVVDQTAPVLTISGVENKGRYQTNEQTVTVIPTDDGGRLNSFKAIVFDRDGKEIGVRFEMSGEELIKYLEDNDGKITFTIPEGLENQVRIVCTDCAMNEDGITNEFDTTFEKVTVSQSKLIIFYANKPLFYGSIAAILAVVGGTIFFVVGKKRKKTEA